jgi:hypothetical protein
VNDCEQHHRSRQYPKNSVAPDVDSLQPDTWDVSFSVVGGIV